MAEELINALSRIKGLSVASRTSSFQFKGQSRRSAVGQRCAWRPCSKAACARQAPAAHQRQLVNVADGFQLWSERYDRTLDDVFAIQDDIASSIARNLEVTFGVKSRDRGDSRGMFSEDDGRRAGQIVKAPTENLEAYHLYLRGRYMANQLGNIAESLLGALDCYSRAAALDPNFAQAHAGVADAYIMLGYYTILPSSEAAEKALAAAERAVALDPGLPEGHTALGWVKTCYGLDMTTAEDDLRRAIDLAPSHVPARSYYGVFLFAMGRFDAAIAVLHDCLARDPSFLVARFSLCHAYVAARRFDEAWREITFLQDLAPDWPGIRWYLALVLGGRGQFREAIEVAEEGTRLAHGAPLFAGQLALMHALAGNRQAAEDILATLSASAHTSAYMLALIHGALGRLDEGFACLQRAVDEHNDNVSLMAVDWRFDPFRNDARFRTLLAQLRLPELPVHA